MKIFARIFCCMLCLSVPAQAAPLAEAACPRQPTRIVVLGDSLADGLWGSFFRTYSRCTTVETLRLTEVSDGLARTSAEEWLERYATEAKPKPEDLVIVQIGANDITTLRDGRSRENFATETWNKMYADRVTQLTRGLKSQASQVFWFGLPIVGKSKLEEPYRAISGIQSAAVEAEGGVFIDIHQLTTFGTGAYAPNGTFEGRLQQLRHSDKVHFTKSGYDFVAAQLLGRLEKITFERDRRAVLQDVQLQ